MKPDTVVSVRLSPQPIPNVLTQLPGSSRGRRTRPARRCHRLATMLAFISCSWRLFGAICGGGVDLYLKNTGTLTWYGCSTSGWGIPGAAYGPISATLAPGETIYWGYPIAIYPYSFATCVSSWNGCGSVTDSGGESKGVFVPGCDCYSCGVRIPVFVEIWPGGRGIDDSKDRPNRESWPGSPLNGQPGQGNGSPSGGPAGPPPNGPPGPGGGGGGGGGSPCGMPVWRVSEPYETLWINDEPFGYQSALGPRVSLSLSYNQRDSQIGKDVHTFSIGAQWGFSWLSYVALDAAGTNVVYLPGGGRITFTNTTDFLTNTRLTGD